MNIAEVILKLEDLGRNTFDPATFPLSLIEAFAPPRATLAKLRQGTLNKATRDGDLLWPKKLHFRPTKEGDLHETLEELTKEWSSKKNQPRLLVSADGLRLAALDTKLEETIYLDFEKLTERYDFFLPLAGLSAIKAFRTVPQISKPRGV